MAFCGGGGGSEPRDHVIKAETTVPIIKETAAIQTENSRIKSIAIIPKEREITTVIILATITLMMSARPILIKSLLAIKIISKKIIIPIGRPNSVFISSELGIAPRLSGAAHADALANNIKAAANAFFIKSSFLV